MLKKILIFLFFSAACQAMQDTDSKYAGPWNGREPDSAYGLYLALLNENAGDITGYRSAERVPVAHRREALRKWFIRERDARRKRIDDAKALQGAALALFAPGLQNWLTGANANKTNADTTQEALPAQNPEPVAPPQEEPKFFEFAPLGQWFNSYTIVSAVGVTAMAVLSKIL